MVTVPVSSAMSKMVRPFVRVRERFWRILDSDAVLVYQGLVYPAVLLAGVYQAVYGVPKSLADALPGDTENLWVVGCFFGPLITLAGLLLLAWDAYFASWLQASGNAAIAGVFGTYITAVISENWGSGIFAPLILVSLSAWSVMLAVRDVRKGIGVERKMLRRSR